MIGPDGQDGLPNQQSGDIRQLFKFKGWHAVIYMPVMGRFYFDFHDDTGIIRDDAGEELPSATAARKEALEVVGQAVKDLTHRHSDGRIVIEVRDGEGPILKVSAVIETTCSKSRAP